tara:strand:+ start:4156 stop:5331 length:1176 start_codon:yes stop_codon:yes gene_type:complete
MKNFLNKISNFEFGKIKIKTPDKKEYNFYGNKKGPKAEIIIKSKKSISKILDKGSLGFAESYLEGYIQTNDLKTLMLFFAKNEKYLNGVLKKNIFTKFKNFIRKKLTENSIKQNKKNISYHYDLGNDFFKHWLDKNLTYSSGIYEKKIKSLEEAQINKLEKICSMLKLKKHHHLLEIGCGWGSFAIYAAKKYKCKITCITLSEKQFLYVKEKIKKFNLNKKIDIQIIDYRNLKGKFDRIASIEMFEAVGEKYWNLYFKKIKELLNPNGIAAFQIITIDKKRFVNYKKNLDFIQKYIFPGGMLPSKEILQKIINRNNLLELSVNNFGKDYSKTLKEWLIRFKNSWGYIKPLGFDDKFKRMWEYYLNYCEIGFDIGTLDLVQISVKNKKNVTF